MLLKHSVKKVETIIENKNKTVARKRHYQVLYCESQPIDTKYFVIDKTWIRDPQLPIHFSNSATSLQNSPRLLSPYASIVSVYDPPWLHMSIHSS
jgi:hypothetical protein